MGRKIKLMEALINLPGRIRDENGCEIEVTFSLYRYQEFFFWIPGPKSAKGLYRVSDKINAPRALLRVGTSVLLSSDEVCASVRLTSEYTFDVQS
jgi:hypothetical protein